MASEESSKPRAAWKDTLSGTVAGMAQLSVGHPFDTVKVRLQTQPTPLPGQLPKFAGAMDCVLKTIKEEGVKGLYKGMGPPLVTVALFNAILFNAYGQAKALLGDPTGATLNLHQIGLAGSFAGIAVSFAGTPTELVKARLQIQYKPKEGEKPLYAGPIDCAKKIIQTGGLRGIYVGFMPTLIRELFGNYFYFAGYEGLKRHLAPSNGAQPSPLSLMFAGGMGGVMFWLPVYPVDLVKSRIQTDLTGQYTGMLDCFRKVIAREGVGALYKGFGPCMARAFPANAATFATYELMINLLGRS